MGDERGATTIEYAVLIALGVLVLIGAIDVISDLMGVVFDAQREQVES